MFNIRYIIKSDGFEFLQLYVQRLVNDFNKLNYFCSFSSVRLRIESVRTLPYFSLVRVFWNRSRYMSFDSGCTYCGFFYPKLWIRNRLKNLIIILIRRWHLSIPCSKVILDVKTLEVNAVTSALLQSPYCSMNDADGDPEFASDDIKKTENYIFNEHQLISGKTR